MKTTLSVKQILHLGGGELLLKVLNFNEVENVQAKLSTGELLDKTYTFDSEFKKDNFDLNELKMFSTCTGKYEDKIHYVIFAESIKDARSKIEAYCGKAVDLDTIIEEDKFNIMYNDDGVLQL